MAFHFKVPRKNKTLKGSAFEREFVEAHNGYRRKHGAPALTLSRDLCSSAQAWADHLLSINTLMHSNTSHGENLYYTWSSTPKTITGHEAVDCWYKEIKDYSFNMPGFSSKTGHFTQVVWKDTREVGVGLSTDGRTIYVVGQYSPAGNVTNEGYFEKNVLPAGTHVTQHSGPAAGAGAHLNVSPFKSNINPSPPCRPSSSPLGPSAMVKGSPASNSAQEQFIGDFVRECNERRKGHGAPPFSLSAGMSAAALAWAETLLKERTLKNSASPHGENIWAKTGSPGITATGKEVVDAWYKEVENYDFAKSGPQKKTGHFTQLVWCSSKEVGVGCANTGTGMIIVVAHFHPPGNITNPGYYARNVLPKGSKVANQSVENISWKMEAMELGPEVNEGQFSQSLLDAQNHYRRQHGAAPLVLSPTLGREAKDWAAHLLKINTLMASGKGHGENMWHCYSSHMQTVTGSEVAESWYKEIEKYNFFSPGYQRGAGNFTQMVWKSSKQVGVGLATDNKGNYIVVAFYEPPGNVTNPGYFNENVRAKGSM